jgi:hypothetical protein
MLRWVHRTRTFAEDLVNARADTPVVCTEDVVKIVGQQGQYAAGHGLCPLILINVATFTVL